MTIKKSVCIGMFLLLLIISSFVCFGQELPGEIPEPPERAPPEEPPEEYVVEDEPEPPPPPSEPQIPEDALPPPSGPEEPDMPEEIRERMERAREGALPTGIEPGERPPEALEPTTRQIPGRYEMPDYSALEQKATYILTAVIILFILVLGDIVLRVVKWIKGE
ncbi:hypothetical protein KY360_05860 [Candidatus Woesearchaeota archaeon]|nr:hypothetical protein [Candidatus Woesearchaeota archaeon]